MLGERRILTCGGAILSCFALVVILVALLRFGFASGHIWLFDLQKYLFALLVSISVLAGYLGNAHVRAGVFDFRGKAGYFRFENLVLVALPAFALACIQVPLLILSWSQLESSGEVGGLPGYFIAKSALAVCFALMAVVAVRRSFRRNGPS